MLKSAPEVGASQLVGIVESNTTKVVVSPELHDAVGEPERLDGGTVAMLGDDLHHWSSDERLAVGRDVRTGHLSNHLSHCSEQG